MGEKPNDDRGPKGIIINRRGQVTDVSPRRRELRAAIEALPSGEISLRDLTNDVIGTFGGPAGSLYSSWRAQRARRVYAERMAEVFDVLAAELERVDKQFQLFLNDGFAELLDALLPLAVRTPMEEKRERFVYLLAHAATQDTDETRERARTLGILLDQLEYKHVVLLERVMKAPTSASLPTPQTVSLGGVTRRLDVLRGELNELLRLETVGMVVIARVPSAGGIRLGDDFLVTPLGVEFYEWVTAPSAP